MTRVHDLGGVQGFGRVPWEPDEPNFHGDWEKRVLGMNLVAKAPEGWNIDKGRHARERLHPVTYLASSYFERWLEGLVLRSVEAGWIEEAEIAAKMGAPSPEAPPDPARVDAMVERFSTRVPYDRPETEGLPAPYAVGDRVRTRMDDPTGHTRLPAYARGRGGEVVMRHGVHVFPDVSGNGGGEAPTHLYAVRFDAAELFGAEAEPGASVTLDLWHPHLEPAS
ncbi:MAG: nitrile hydratase subunit beta [Paracoccaceae bacterium]